jgi:glutaredoxin 1
MSFPEPYGDGFTIYTKNNCPYCVKAKTILTNTKLDFHIIECDGFLETNRTAFLDFIRHKIGRDYKTFPMIFDKNDFVGGYSELQSYIDRKNAFDF